MERVTGIGGLFFRARGPEALSRWYADHLGIPRPPATYEAADWWQEAGPTVFAPFPADTDHLGRPDQAWRLNLRVRDPEALIAQLRAAGVAVERPTRRRTPTGGSPSWWILRATRSSCGSPPRPCGAGPRAASDRCARCPAAGVFTPHSRW